MPFDYTSSLSARNDVRATAPYRMVAKDLHGFVDEMRMRTNAMMTRAFCGYCFWISLAFVLACDHSPRGESPADAGYPSLNIDLVFSTDWGNTNDGQQDSRDPKEVAHDGGGDSLSVDSTSDQFSFTDGAPKDMGTTDSTFDQGSKTNGDASANDGNSGSDGFTNNDATSLDGVILTPSDSAPDGLPKDAFVDVIAPGADLTPGTDLLVDSQAALFAILPAKDWTIAGDEGTSLIGAIQKYSVVNNSSSQSITVTAVTTQSWLVVAPASQLLAPNASATFTLSLSGVGLFAAGPYEADVQFSSGAETVARKTDLHMNVNGGEGWSECSPNPVISVGAPGSPSEMGVTFPFVRKTPSGYEAWYTQADTNAVSSLTYATSTDGVSWSPTNAVLFAPPGSPSWNKAVHGFSILEDEGTYKMWLTVSSSVTSNDGRIMYLTSPDGQSWTVGNGGASVLAPATTGGSWDADGVRDPSVMRRMGTYEMWYAGYSLAGADAVVRIGHATSADGVNWTKDPSNPLNIGSGRNAYAPHVIFEAGIYRVWYGSPSLSDPDEFDLWYAFSPLGQIWQDAKPQPTKTAASLPGWNGLGFLHGVSVVRNSETSLRLWYGSQPSLVAPGPQIGCLTIP